MKKRTLISALVLVLIVAMTLPVLAASSTREATLTYRDIKIVLDGTEITPKDVNGNSVEPFIIDGTTYLPVRAVADALGLDVTWDEETSTVSLGETSRPVTNLDELSFNAQYTMRTLNYKAPSSWTPETSDTTHYFYANKDASASGGYIRCVLNSSETDINTKGKAQSHYDAMYKDLNSVTGTGKITKSEISVMDDHWYGSFSYTVKVSGSTESVMSGVIMKGSNVYVLTLAVPEADSEGLDTAFEKLIDSVSFVDTREGSFTLGAGSYIVGEDLKAGKYDVTVVSGMGSFYGTVASVSGGLVELMGESGTGDPFETNQSYRNLRLANKDEINISDTLVLRFTTVG